MVVTRDLPGVSLARILEAGFAADPPPRSAMPRDELLRRVRGACGLLCTLLDRIDGEVMDAAGPALRVVSNYAVGCDNIDVAGATRRGIRVCNTPDVLTEATADLGFALLLAAARRLSDAERFLRAGRWEGWDPFGFLGVPVYGATLGIVGLGKIGRAVAARARGFSMEVLYHNRNRLAPEAEERAGARYRDLDRLLAEADFVVLSLPLTPSSRGLIDRRRIGLMKPGAVLVNIARGGVVDEAALAEALCEGRIFAAGLDVFEGEPLVDPALLAAPATVLTPHLGSATRQARGRMGELAVANLLAVLSGQEPPCAVN